MAIFRIRDADGNVQEIFAIKGEKGDSYILTYEDKMEIANIVASLMATPANEDENGSREAVIINFSIEDYQFQAEEGMTWREWVNSEYNSEGACAYNEGEDTIRFVEYSLNVLRSDTPVKGSDPIISGHFYYLS